MRKSNQSESAVFRARAPLRLGFAGGGTDVAPYSDEFGGLVLNATISKFAYATIEVRTDGMVSFCNADTGKTWTGPAATQLPVEAGLDLHCGVYNRIAKEFSNGQILSVNVTTHSEAPPGSGLGSSSTMVVALVKAFSEMLSLPLGDYDTAHLAFEIERIDLGMAGGKQDQYAAAFGGLNFIEFYGERVIVNPLRIKPHHRAEFEASLLLYFTGVSRQSAAIVNEQVKNMESKSVSSLKALHELKADATVMKEAMLKGDLPMFADAMRRSWSAKKKTAISVSNSAIDQIFDRALESGALAGKVSGAGGGGFMMFLVEPTKRANVIRELSASSGQVMTCGIVEYGAHAWRVK
jgi:D-glycero-alpha-D-manno-heptose-7-phosphate kinase